MSFIVHVNEKNSHSNHLDSGGFLKQNVMEGDWMKMLTDQKSLVSAECAGNGAKLSLDATGET